MTYTISQLIIEEAIETVLAEEARKEAIEQMIAEEVAEIPVLSSMVSELKAARPIAL